MIFLTLNYVILSGVFIYRYFNPKQWTVWLIESSFSYYIIFFLTMFLLIFSMFYFHPLFLCMLPLLTLFLVAIFMTLKKQLQKIGGGSIIPFILYLFTLGQEMYYVWFKSSIISVGALFIWYFAGVFVMLLGGILFGAVLSRLFPKLSSRHMAIMKKEFGRDAPRVLRFKDGTKASGTWNSAADFVGIMVMYSIWMIVRIFFFQSILAF